MGTKLANLREMGVDTSRVQSLSYRLVSPLGAGTVVPSARGRSLPPLLPWVSPPDSVSGKASGKGRST